MKRHDPQPVIQILAQHVLLDGLLRVAIGAGDEPHVDDRVGVLAAHATDYTVLDHAQELGLDRFRHLDELVEQQRAAIGRLQEAGLVAHRARECALHMSEHLRFE